MCWLGNPAGKLSKVVKDIIFKLWTGYVMVTVTVTSQRDMVTVTVKVTAKDDRCN